MQAHQLQRHTPQKKPHRVGRGGTRGKTSGRGHKGQKARAGTGMRPEERDMIKKLPKLRGHGKNRARSVNSERERPRVVTLATLERLFESGETVTPRALVAHGVVARFKGRTPKIKVLASGTLTKQLTVSQCLLSSSAKNAIKAAGGVISD